MEPIINIERKEQFMSLRKSWLKLSLFGLAIFMGFILVASPMAQAQNWINLPPYNTLWPLWSPPLSPINPLSGLPTPIVSNLRPSTVLPVQPGLTWDPRQDYPWLLYNTPIGMAYYDPLYGVNTWPAPYLRDPITSLPAPIDLALIKGWSTLLPTSTSWLGANLPVSNNAFINAYPAYAVAYEILSGGTLASYPIFASLLNPAPPLQSLLTTSLLAGLGPLVP
jgi:hypothetical protein